MLGRINYGLFTHTEMVSGIIQKVRVESNINGVVEERAENIDNDII